MIKIRNASIEDANLFYPERLKSFKAWVIEKDSKPIAIGGFVFYEEGNVMFVKCEEQTPKKTLWQASKKMMQEAQKTGRPLFAIRDETLKTSKNYLTKLGFVFSHINELNKEVYLWVQPQQ